MDTDFDSSELDAIPGAAMPMRFSGPDITEEDTERLEGQMLRVFDVIKSGEWFTLNMIQSIIVETTGKNDQTQSISARLRDLRKKRFGLHTVNRVNLGDGLFAYRLIINKSKEKSIQDFIS